MKTYDHGYDESKDKDQSGTSGQNAARNMVLRYVESLSQEQIYRMIDTHTQSRFIKKKEDPTGREIMRRSMEQNDMVIQARLEISQPEDAHEKQADELAQTVAENNPGKSQTILNEKPSDVQTKSDGGPLTTSPEFDQQLSATKGQGRPLDESTKGKLEAHTGKDLSDVKIHTGSTAGTLSEGINAKAFTHGQDIYFKGGNFNPQTPEGEKLLAHEVAHTVQQRNGVERKVMRQPLPKDSTNTSQSGNGASNYQPMLLSPPIVLQLPGVTYQTPGERRTDELKKELAGFNAIYHTQPASVSPEQQELKALAGQLAKPQEREAAIEQLGKKAEKGWDLVMATVVEADANTKAFLIENLLDWYKTKPKFKTYVNNLARSKTSLLSPVAALLLIKAGKSGQINTEGYKSLIRSKLNQAVLFAEKLLPKEYHLFYLKNFTGDIHLILNGANWYPALDKRSTEEVIDFALKTDILLNRLTITQGILGRLYPFYIAASMNPGSPTLTKFTNHFKTIAGAMYWLGRFRPENRVNVENAWKEILNVGSALDAEIKKEFPAEIKSSANTALDNARKMKTALDSLPNFFPGRFDASIKLGNYIIEFQAIAAISADISKTIETNPEAFIRFWMKYNEKLNQIRVNIRIISYLIQIAWAQGVFDTYSKFDLSIYYSYAELFKFGAYYKLCGKWLSSISGLLYDDRPQMAAINNERLDEIVDAKQMETMMAEATVKSEHLDFNQNIADWSNRIGWALLALAAAIATSGAALSVLGVSEGAAVGTGVMTLEATTATWQTGLFVAMVQSYTLVLANKAAIQLQGGNPQWDNFGMEYLQTLALFGILGEVNMAYNTALRPAVTSIGKRVLFEGGKLITDMTVLMGADYVFYQLSPEEKGKYNFTERLIDNITLYAAVRISFVTTQELSPAEEEFPYQKKARIKQLNGQLQETLKTLSDYEVTKQQYERIRKMTMEVCKLRAEMLEQMSKDPKYANDKAMYKQASEGMRQLVADLQAEIVADLNIRDAPNLPGIKYFDGSPKELERYLKTQNPGGQLTVSAMDKNTWVYTDAKGKTQMYINSSPEFSGGENIRSLVESEHKNWENVKEEFGSDGSSKANRLLYDAWTKDNWRPGKAVPEKYADELAVIKKNSATNKLLTVFDSNLVEQLSPETIQQLSRFKNRTLKLFAESQPPATALELTDFAQRMKGVSDLAAQQGIKLAFIHPPTSGALIPANVTQGTFLIGAFESDLKFILSELGYPVAGKVNMRFPTPAGEQFNLLNISTGEYEYWVKEGGFFKKVNGPWIDAAVAQGQNVIVVSDPYLYVYERKTKGGVQTSQLTGFGKEIYRLEWVHDYRYDPATKQMIPAAKAGNLPRLTEKQDYN